MTSENNQRECFMKFELDGKSGRARRGRLKFPAVPLKHRRLCPWVPMAP